MANEAAKIYPRIKKFISKGVGLDLGCGPFKLKEATDGVDNDPYEGVCHMPVLDFLKKTPDESYDWVFSSHYFEHEPQIREVLKNIQRVLKPGGILLAYLPNVDVYKGASGEDPNGTHVNHWTPGSFIDELLRTTNLNISTVSSYNTVPVGYAFTGNGFTEDPQSSNWEYSFFVKADKKIQTQNCKMIQDLSHQFPWPATRPELPVDLGPVWYVDDPNGSHSGVIKSIVSPESKVILELGSFMGRSTKSFLRICPEAVVICVDTWDGSVEHKDDPQLKQLLPRLHEQFLANMWDDRNRIIPVQHTTLNGIEVIDSYGVIPDWIYIDADHSEESVISDINKALCYFPEAQIIGDDWLWASVRSAVEKSALYWGCEIETHGPVWWFKKD